MTSPFRTLAAGLAVACAFVTFLSHDSRAYTTEGAKWSKSPVPYFVNADNLDLAVAPTTAAVRAGADVWANQTNAAFSFSYAGPSTQTTNTMDGTNLVLFRNAANGNAIATTYYWYNSSGFVDADIVFWDGGFQFFAGTSGCSNGFYIEDIAAHEFGHALGLGHSTVAAATMYPSVSSCNQSNRILDADDIDGILSLYGPRTGSTSPAPPTGLRITGVR
jgi:Matrixin